METVKKSRLMVLVVAFLIMVNIFAMPEPIYAADDVAQMDATKGQFSLDMKSQSVLSGGEVGGTVTNAMANMLFSFQKSMTMLTIKAYDQMAGGDDDHLSVFEKLLDSKIMGIFNRLFNINTGNGIVMMAIAIVMVGAMFALIRMNIADMVSKIAKFFIIFIIGVLITTNGAVIFNSLNNVVKGASNDITASLSNADSNYGSVEDILWDVGVVTPWKILQFGTTTRAAEPATKWGNNPPTTACAELQTALEEKGESNANEALKGLSKGSVGRAYILSSADTSAGYRKEVADNAWKTSNKVTDGEEAESTGTYNISTFAPTLAAQGDRLGAALILFLMTFIVCVVTLIVSIIILAVKIFAFIVFFVGPLILIIAWMSPEGMEIVKRWGMFLGIIFLGSLACQVLLTIYVLIVGAVLGGSNVINETTFMSPLLILIAMILAIRFGGGPLLKIIAPQMSRRAKTELRQDQMLKAMQSDGGSGGSVTAATKAKAATGNPRAMGKVIGQYRDKSKNGKEADKEAAKWGYGKGKPEPRKENKNGKGEDAASKVNEQIRQRDNSLGETHKGKTRKQTQATDISAAAAEAAKREKTIKSANETMTPPPTNKTTPSKQNVPSNARNVSKSEVIKKETAGRHDKVQSSGGMANAQKPQNKGTRPKPTNTQPQRMEKNTPARRKTQPRSKLN